MRQIIIPKEDFIFDASLKTITFFRPENLILEEIYYISNVTDGIPIFRQGCENITGTVSGKILTLDYNTTAMSDDDALLVVFVDNNEATETNRLLGEIMQQSITQKLMLDELRLCSKYLKKIYNPI